MDVLESLPVKDDAVNTNEERSVMNKYGFNAAASGGAPGAPPQSASSSHDEPSIRWKLVMWTTALFILLSNQYVDSFLSRLPYLSNSLVRLAVRIVVFAFAFFAISYFITN